MYIKNQNFGLMMLAYLKMEMTTQQLVCSNFCFELEFPEDSRELLNSIFYLGYLIIKGKQLKMNINDN